MLQRENERQAEITELTSKGLLPHEEELAKVFQFVSAMNNGADYEVPQNPKSFKEGRAWLMGSIAALIHDVLPAKVIIETMVADAARIMQENASLVSMKPKL